MSSPAHCTKRKRFEAELRRHVDFAASVRDSLTMDLTPDWKPAEEAAVALANHTLNCKRCSPLPVTALSPDGEVPKTMLPAAHAGVVAAAQLSPYSRIRHF